MTPRSQSGGGRGSGLPFVGSKVPQYLVWSVIAILVVGPLFPIFQSAFWSTPLYEVGGTISLGQYETMLGDPAFWAAAKNTVYLALFCAVPSMLIGTALAVLVVRTNMAFRRLLNVILIVPLLFPGLGIVLGWITMYSPAGYMTLIAEDMFGSAPWNIYSIPGMAIVEWSKTIPLVYLFARGTLAGMDPSLENAALTSGASGMRAIRSITLPMLRPAAVSGALIVMAVAMESLGVPLLLGTPSRIDTLTTYLYNSWNRGDPGVVSAGGTLLLLAITVLLLLRNWSLGAEARFTTQTGKPKGRQQLSLGNWRWVAGGLVLAYATLTVIVPLTGLVSRAFTQGLVPGVSPLQVFTLGNFAELAQNEIFTRSIINSSLIAFVGAAVGTVGVALATIVAHRSPFKLRRTLPGLLLYPRAIPGIVLGLGFFWVVVSIELLQPLRTSIWALMVAFMVRQFALAYGAIAPALSSIGTELDQAARTAGASWWQASVGILLPLLRPAMIASFLLMFVAMLSDYDPAVFLVTPGTEVMGLTMLLFWAEGFAGPVAALGVVQLLITAIVLLIGWLTLERNRNA